MTIIKQKAVSSEKHARNLKDYIDGKDALLRAVQNIYEPRAWYAEMEELRREFGHDCASRVGAKNTVIYHQILAFLPEEADINGGPMTPERCMEYAREYAAKRYGDYKVAFALHLEKSPTVALREEAREAVRQNLELGTKEMSYVDRALEKVYSTYEARGRIPRKKGLAKALQNLDGEETEGLAARILGMEHDPCGEGTDMRYAIHMAINRTNQVTGNRLNEGLGQKAKRDRAETVRRMDEFWGLRQVEEGRRNSEIHPRQPQVGRLEKAMEEKGRHSYKADLRFLSQSAAKQAVDLNEFASLLKNWGAIAVVQEGKVYVGDEDHPADSSGKPYMFSVGKLDPTLKPKELERKLHGNAVARIERKIEEKARLAEERLELRDAYMERLDRAFSGYRRLVFASKGKPYASFPELKLPKPPGGLGTDGEVQRKVTDLRRQAELLRSRYASGTPAAPKKSAASASGSLQRHRAAEHAHGERGRSEQR